MKFQRFSKDQQLMNARELSKKAVEHGKDSFFSSWWYFDTNCFSELAKLSLGGHSAAVHNFVKGKDILLTTTSMQELRKVPAILRAIPSALETAKLYLVPDITRFWYTDIFNFLNVDKIQLNSLEVLPLKADLLEMITKGRSAEFEQICAIAERNLAESYPVRVMPGIGAALDERDLGVHIWSVVNKSSLDWFKIGIPPADCNVINFPAFYVYYYAYYFRYIKSSNVKPDTNDFNDLANCLPVPYCEKYFCEAAFAHILKKYVKGRKPPTSFELIKKIYKKGLVTQEIYEGQRKDKDKLSNTAPMLEHTFIFSFAEMRSQIIG